MTCKNTEWEPKICPYCQYDVCSIRYRHNLHPVDVIGLNFKIDVQLLEPITENFSEKLKEEFQNVVMNHIVNNSLISVQLISMSIKDIKKE